MDQHQLAPFVGTTGEPYITTLHKPYPGYAVLIPTQDGSGRYARKDFAGLRLSQEEYLARARQWRDETHLQLYDTPVPARAFHSHQANSSTGVPGVRFLVKKVRSRHNRDRIYEVPVYLAVVWLIPGRDGEPPKKSRSRLFSIPKYGQEEAFRLACEWRAAAEAALLRGDSLP